MKKIYTLCLSAFLGMSAFAQTQPERIVVHEKSGQFKGFLAERVDSITFPKVEGRIAADVVIEKVYVDSAIVNIQRTPNCRAFKLLVIPEVTANMLTDDAQMADFIDRSTQDLYYEDFERGVLSGANFDPDTKYVFATVGYDMYGIPCGVVRAPFQTPKRPLVGDVFVEAEFADTTARSFSCNFYPSPDVKGFAVVTGEAGTMQAQYEQWGPMMGFKNFGDLVRAWGFQGAQDEVGFVWKDMTPDTEYDLFVQAWDVNDTYADCDTLKIRTKALGGEGVAAVDVKLGDYKLNDWNGEMKPSQDLILTPNDQTSCYRFTAELDSVYNLHAEEINNELRQDPPFPMSNWFFYEPMTTDIQVNPNVDFVVLTAAKNSLGVWSEVKVDRFTTPAEVEGGVPAPAPAVAKIGKRNIKNHTYYVQPGTVPEFFKAKKANKITLK